MSTPLVVMSAENVDIEGNESATSAGVMYCHLFDNISIRELADHGELWFFVYLCLRNILTYLLTTTTTTTTMTMIKSLLQTVVVIVVVEGGGE